VKPPISFTGPKCPVAPKQINQCLAQCNCPPRIARQLTSGVGVGIDDDLGLFDANGEPTPKLSLVIKNLALQEVGMTVSDNLIQDGIALAKPFRR
jgi:hypothetical protein